MTIRPKNIYWLPREIANRLALSIQPYQEPLKATADWSYSYLPYKFIALDADKNEIGEGFYSKKSVFLFRESGRLDQILSGSTFKFKNQLRIPGGHGSLWDQAQKEKVVSFFARKHDFESK